jgi:hypothetical protein
MAPHRAFFFAALAGLTLVAAPSFAQSCRQALALGLDVSGSVDQQEYRLQLDGLAAALTSTEVRAALLAHPDAPIRIAVYEWSGPTDQTLILDWTTLDSDAALLGAVARLTNHQRGPKDLTTGLGAALRFGGALLAGQSDCWKHTLDISGDGPSNTGPRPQDVRDLPAGITVNALAIGQSGQAIGDDREADIKELSSYFRATVIRGPDAFVETALGFQDYEAAMRRKLLRELQSIAIGSAFPSVTDTGVVLK